jgi:hypothetical protein
MRPGRGSRTSPLARRCRGRSPSAARSPPTAASHAALSAPTGLTVTLEGTTGPRTYGCRFQLSPGTPPPPRAPRWRPPPATALEGPGSLKAFFELRHAEQPIRQQPVHRAHVRWSSGPRRADHHHGHRGHDQRRRRGRGDHPGSGRLVLVTPIPSLIRSRVSHGSKTPPGHGHLLGRRTASSPGTPHSRPAYCQQAHHGHIPL